MGDYSLRVDISLIIVSQYFVTQTIKINAYKLSLHKIKTVSVCLLFYLALPTEESSIELHVQNSPIVVFNRV